MRKILLLILTMAAVAGLVATTAKAAPVNELPAMAAGVGAVAPDAAPDAVSPMDAERAAEIRALEEEIRRGWSPEFVERLKQAKGQRVPHQEQVTPIDNFDAPVWPDPSLWLLVRDNTDPPEEFGEYFWAPRDCRFKSFPRSLWAVGGGEDGSQLACGSDYPNGAFSEAVLQLDLTEYADATKLNLVFDYWLNLRTEEEGGVAADGLFIAHIFLDETGNPVPAIIDNPTSAFPLRFFDEPRVIDLLNAQEVHPPHRTFNLAGEAGVLIDFIFKSSEAQSTRMEGVFIDDVRLVSDTSGQPSDTATPGNGTTTTPETPTTPPPTTETPPTTPPPTTETMTPTLTMTVVPTDTVTATVTVTTTETVTPTVTVTATETVTTTVTPATATPTDDGLFSVFLPIGYQTAPVDWEPSPDMTPTPEVTPEVLTVVLDEQGDSGKTGTADLTQSGPDLDVVVELVPAIQAESFPAGIYAGSCDVLGDEMHPLTVVSNGLSETTLTDVTLAELQDGNHALAVSESLSEPDSVIACGNIPAEDATPVAGSLQPAGEANLVSRLQGLLNRR